MSNKDLNKTINYEPQNLFVLDGSEEETTPYDWDDMPDFNQPHDEAYKILNIRFRNEADYREFANLIGQRNLTHRTKSIWYPVLDKKAHSLMRYIDEDDIMDTERMTVLKDDEIVSVSDTPPALVALDIE
jgi:hypothetical protein|tara:strand:- start:468 stop:857 length:390 start_codon:yes stop_codon:yes gene_type:complete